MKLTELKVQKGLKVERCEQKVKTLRSKVDHEECLNCSLSNFYKYLCLGPKKYRRLLDYKEKTTGSTSIEN